MPFPPHGGRRLPPRCALPARLPRSLVVAIALSASACTASAPAPGTAATEVAALPRAVRQRLVFDSVWTIVRREHVDSLLDGADWDAARARLRERAAAADDERELYRVLAALVAPIHDAHTYVLPPSAVAREHARRNAARGEGLGIALEVVDGRVLVAGVQPASAAGRAGVRPGWLLERWNGAPVDSAALAAGRFGAGRGDTIAITFADSVDEVREHLIVPSPYRWSHPRSVRRVDGVAVVRVPGFEPGMGSWLLRAVAAQHDARALVIDLRGNPGGQMAELARGLGAVFPRAQLIGRFIERDGRSGRLSARGGGGAAFAGPVVVLVDRRSGSAAEIFAAVVQGSGRGRVVGERTAGAVLNAFPYRLPDGGRLHVSRRDFRDPCDVRLERTGVSPRDSADVVPRRLDDARRGRDPALARALQAATSGEPAPGGCAWQPMTEIRAAN